MNLLQRIHEQSSNHAHEKQAHSQNIPFWVRYYDWILNIVTLGKTRSIYQATISLANLQVGESILDIGCGTGKLILEAEKVIGQAGTAVGLDVEPAMIQQAREHARKRHSQARFEVASIDNIPYPDESFDVAISSLVYHHLTNAQKEAGFTELNRILKPNGRLLIVDMNPNRRSIVTVLPGHNQLKKEDYVQTIIPQQMKMAGFANVRSGPHPAKQLSYALAEKEVNA